MCSSDLAETWANFKGIVGSTWSELHEAMRRAAADLAESSAGRTQVFSGQELMIELVHRAQLGQSDASGFEWKDVGAEIGNDVPGPEMPIDPITLPPEVAASLTSLTAKLNDCDCGCGCGSSMTTASAGDVSAAAAGPNSPACWYPEYNFTDVELALYERIAQAIVATQTAAYGVQTGVIMTLFLNSTYENQVGVIPFEKGSEIVEGTNGKDGFRNSESTKKFLELVEDLVREEVQERLEKGEITCDELPIGGDGKQFVEGPRHRGQK